MANQQNRSVIGVIGGSGVYDIEGLTNKRWEHVNSSFGEASDELLFGELNGQQMVFLPRHGRGHKIPAREAGIEVARGGTYLVMEGPQFSSLAESELYRSWNCDVIGMTNMPEAKLAREAELCYATVAMVTDYDCWHPNHDDVTVDAIIKVLLANADNARSLIRKVAPRLHGDGKAATCNCRSALGHALITAPEARDPVMIKRLDAVAGRLLNSR